MSKRPLLQLQLKTMENISQLLLVKHVEASAKNKAMAQFLLVFESQVSILSQMACPPCKQSTRCGTAPEPEPARVQL